MSLPEHVHAAEQLMTVNFRVNSQAVTLRVAPRELLIDVLRDRLDFTGVKRSCDMQICGACTVLVDGQPVSSCTYLAFEADGKELETIEGLALGGQLHPVQRAFIDCGGSQCGFCTPGMVLTVKALLAENPSPSREQIIAYLEGNICRCTGYLKIIESVEAVARSLRQE